MGVTSHMALIFIALIIFLQDVLSLQAEVKKFPLLMPGVNPSRNDLYVCTPVKINQDENFYIVGFEPKATMNTVHHMLLISCSLPGSSDAVWDCGEMSSGVNDGTFKRANPCKEGSHVIYAWARDAPALTLPDDVGFQVGNGTDVAYLVLQVHYAHKFPKDYIDSSGVDLVYTKQPQSKLAGVLLLASGGIILPHTTTLMDTACKIDEDKVIYPIAFRTHTHSLGKVVSGYKVTRDEYDDDHWTLIGKGDPMKPQMFYPTFNTDPIKKGDTLAARCTMKSDRDRVTNVGPTNEDEMCNMYLVYYVTRGKPLDLKYCVSEGPPYYSWNNSENNFRNIPDDTTVL